MAKFPAERQWFVLLRELLVEVEENAKRVQNNTRLALAW